MKLKYVNLNMMEIIEKAGRTCYKSEHKISQENNTASKFVKAIVKSGHESVIEHSNLVFQVPNRSFVEELRYYNPLVTYGKCRDKSFLVGGNIRIWKDTIRAVLADVGGFENLYTSYMSLLHWLELLPRELFEDFYADNIMVPIQLSDCSRVGSMLQEVTFCNSSYIDNIKLKTGESNFGNNDIEIINVDLGNPKTRYQFAEKNNIDMSELDKVLTMTVLETKARIITQQDDRHRTNCSYSQESQRYVNYAKEGNSVEAITNNLLEYLPFDSKKVIEYNNEKYLIEDILSIIATSYHQLVNKYHIRPEDARFMFTNSAKSTQIVTRTLPAWSHYFSLRCDKDHAQHQINTTSNAILHTCRKHYNLFMDFTCPDDEIEMDYTPLHL